MKDFLNKKFFQIKQNVESILSHTLPAYKEDVEIIIKFIYFV